MCMCSAAGAVHRAGESAKRSCKHNFEFQLTYLSIYFYPIDFDCLRPLDQNARAHHRCGIRTHTSIKFYTWLCSISPIAFLPCSARCSCASLLLFFFSFRVVVFVIVLHFSCVCECSTRSNRFSSAILSMWCDFKSNQNGNKKIRYDMLPFANPYPHIESIVSTVFVITIFHRFYFNATWT